MKLSSLYEELSSRKVQAIIKRKPDFFQNRVRFVLGAENGVFDFEINISPEDIGHSYDGDWESVLDYYLSPENEETIRGYINQLIKREGKEIEDHEGESLQDLLEQYDTEDHIKNVLRDSLSNAQADDYVNYLKEQLRDCLMEYGDIKSFDHEGATLKIKFSTLLDMLGLDVDDVDVIDKMDEDCGYDPKCYFEEMFYKNTYDSPSFKPDERYSGDASNEDVNSMIVDRLGEVGYDYKIEG